MRPRVALGVLIAGALTGASARAQEPRVAVQPLPHGDLFRPLLADPKQPQFFASYLWVSSPRLTSRFSAVGLGENIGLVRWPRHRWQLSLATGVFSQFDMGTESYDLVNTDFTIGPSLTHRRADFAARVRVYHQSSHLGDEFLLNTRPNRVNLSFESVDVLASWDLGSWRVYGGGEYLVRRDPRDLKAGLLHGGLEARGAAPLLRLGSLGGGRFVAALDGKSSEERKWSLALSLVTGLEFDPASQTGRRWSVLLHLYDGPAPYGQFYTDNVSSIGIGFHFSL